MCLKIDFRVCFGCRGLGAGGGGAIFASIDLFTGQRLNYIDSFFKGTGSINHRRETLRLSKRQ